MKGKKICITTDCTCDLPQSFIKKYNIPIVYFYIDTDTGCFKDVDEITSNNIFEYLINGGEKSETNAPPAEEFVDIFSKLLTEYDEVIHIAISSKISECVKNSTASVAMLGEDGKRVHVFDSGHLSTGIGHLVIRAAQLAQTGCTSEEIIAELELMKKRVSTTFMADNADYLYRNGKVSKTVKNICNFFNIHPVLEMRDGFLKLKSMQIGNYEKSALRYVRKELKDADNIKKARIFITHAGCSVSDIKLVKEEITKLKKFDEILVTKASATISGNSGPRTFGVLFERE